MNDRFLYQSEKLNSARSSLMAPHPRGETEAFASAFLECSLAFEHFDIEEVKYENARNWIKTIQRLMDTTGLQDTSGTGLFHVRIEQMSLDEKREFSRAVDELASWFDRNFWQK